MKKYSILLMLITMTAINISFAQTDKQTVHPFEKEVTIKLSTNYLFFLPENYSEEGEAFPLVLFLHGAGERGSDIEKVKAHGLPRLISEGKNFPFIVVSPQCPENQFWNTDMLAALLDEIESNYNVDKNRIYVTGLSMGGHGTWSLALQQPERFAAIAPVCGWSNPEKACTLKEIPIWVFHGAKDFVVPVSSSEQMVDKLKECGADVTLTIYPEAGHDSWTETYNNDELYKWLLSHSLKK
ncbi:MAG: prolyl oligopeptidase family serine peptidase [Ignavibacteriales bacterium]|nr:MAG: prolyl oligopeptidase family serine peptidase [Ignavibacteriales bacterium]